jgi:hypothetical protein
MDFLFNVKKFGNLRKHLFLPFLPTDVLLRRPFSGPQIPSFFKQNTWFFPLSFEGLQDILMAWVLFSMAFRNTD